MLGAGEAVQWYSICLLLSLFPALQRETPRDTEGEEGDRDRKSKEIPYALHHPHHIRLFICSRMAPSHAARGTCSLSQCRWGRAPAADWCLRWWVNTTHMASAGPPCQSQTLWQAKPSPSAKSQWELSAKTPGVKQTQLISASKPPPKFPESATTWIQGCPQARGASLIKMVIGWSMSISDFPSKAPRDQAPLCLPFSPEQMQSRRRKK